MIVIWEIWGFILVTNFTWNLIPLKANEQSGTITASHLLARGVSEHKYNTNFNYFNLKN